MEFAAAVATSADSFAGGHRGARWREKQFCHHCPHTQMVWGREWWNSPCASDSTKPSLKTWLRRVHGSCEHQVLCTACKSLKVCQSGPPQHSLRGWKLVFVKPWTSQSSGLILDGSTCLPPNALQVRLTPPQVLPHFIFAKKEANVPLCSRLQI